MNHQPGVAQQEIKEKVGLNSPLRPISSSSGQHNSRNNNHVDDNAVVTSFDPKSVHHIPQPFFNMTKSVEGKKKITKKFTKADISMKTNFRHVTHIPWTAQNGFEFTGQEAKTLQPFLEKADVSDHRLKDRETRQFIYDFINNHKVLDNVNSEHSNQTTTPPPVPTRNENQNGLPRIAPPRPPTTSRQPPPVPLKPYNHKEVNSVQSDHPQL